MAISGIVEYTESETQRSIFKARQQERLNAHGKYRA